MRSPSRTLRYHGGLGLIIAALGCGDVTTAPPAGGAGVMVYGRVTTGSGFVIAGSVVTVRLLADTIPGIVNGVQCSAGLPLATVAQVADTGWFRLDARTTADSSRVVCLEVTGDPGSQFSDVGLRRLYRVATIHGSPLDSLRVDVKFQELP